MSRPIEEIRRDFWAFVTQKDPAIRTYTDTNAWAPLTEDGTVIVVFGIEQDGSSVFLRGRLYEPDTAGRVLSPHAAALGKALSAPFEADGDAGQGRYFRKRNKAAFTLKSQWPEIARWFSACRLRYGKVVGETLEDWA
jgi:hypothetical protein